MEKSKYNPDSYKVVRVQFTHQREIEGHLRKFINDALMKKKARLPDNQTQTQDREDVRAIFENLLVDFQADGGETVEAVETKAKVVDLSSGGAGVLVEKHIKLVKNGSGSLTFRRVDPILKLDFIILGIKPMPLFDPSKRKIKQL